MRPPWWALGLAMLWPTLMAGVYFVALSGPAEGGRSANPAVQAVYGAGKAAQFLFPVLIFRLMEGHWPRPGRPSFAGLKIGLLFGLLVAAAILGLYWFGFRGQSLFHGTSIRIRTKVEEFGLATPLGYLLLAGFLSVAHSLMEEYYWRWFVFGGLRKGLPRLPAYLLSCAAFTSHHVIVLWMFFPTRPWSAVLPFSLQVAVGGAVWAWLYERTGSVYSPWLSHALVDAAILAVGYDLIFVLPQ